MLNVLDLFSGIGGFSLGLERTGGFQTVAFCEIESYPQAVLAKHWPGVPIYDDVRRIMADTQRMRESQPQGGERDQRGWPGYCCYEGQDGRSIGPIDVITAGFPCQDISVAGKGAGITGERSGLWSEVARLAGELRPRYLILENVAALLGRGLGTVLGDLAEIGYDCEWHCIPASHIGAPHRRDRWWCVAYPTGERERPGPESGRDGGRGEFVESTGQGSNPDNSSKEVAYPNSQRGRGGNTGGQYAEDAGQPSWGQRFNARRMEIWTTEPNVGRVAHGIPKRVDRLKGLGNAVVPQIPELIGRAILESST